MMSFVQIVEYETDHAEEIDAKMRDGIESGPPMTFTRLTHTQDRGNPNRYLDIVEFPSYDVAMANSSRPETDQLAKEMASLCTSGPHFYDLDVIMTMP